LTLAAGELRKVMVPIDLSQRVPPPVVPHAPPSLKRRSGDRGGWDEIADWREIADWQGAPASSVESAKMSGDEIANLPTTTER